MTGAATRLGAALLVATGLAAPLGAAGAAPVWFDEVALESGLDFVHFNGMNGRLYMVEILGAGAALFDYDNDGDLDLLVLQGAVLAPGGAARDALFPPSPAMLPLRARLYRNDLETSAGGRRLRFTDVTAASGLEATGYGMGVATGDVDGDGFVDVYITNFGANQLWHNNGNGTFRDVTATAGVDDPRWNVGATFLDYDRDGDLDLYVSAYLEFSVAAARTCFAASGDPDYCGPSTHPHLPDRLFRNRGNGTFEDLSKAAGITAAFGPALGVVVTDANGDGWPDLYVANDRDENQLWVNNRNGSFSDQALLAGCAVDFDGRAGSSMGVASGDPDGDGDDDLFVTHLRGETNTLYLNQGSSYQDATIRAGLAAPSLGHTCFGTHFFDLDNDGDEDLLTVNGAMARIPELVAAGDPFPLHETNQLYLNTGGGRFTEITASGGPAFALSELSTGAAFGDVDNDGDTDVVVVNNSGRLRLLRNRGEARHHWLGLRLVGGATAHRDQLGATVEVALADGRRLRRRAHSDGSYASASDPRVLVGLGPMRQPPAVTVTWPNGARERFVELPVDRYTTLVQGSGQALGTPSAELPRPLLDGMEAQARTQVEELFRRADELAAASAPASDLAAARGAVAMALHAYELCAAASQWYRAAALLDPASWRWPYLLGHSLTTSGDLDGAAGAFARAVELAPTAVLPKLHLAQSLSQLGDTEQARELLRAALAAQPELAAAHAALGDVAMARGDPEGAIAAYRRALALQPSASRLHGQLAVALARTGHDEQARAHLAQRGREPVAVADELLTAVAVLNLNASTHLDRCMDALAAERLEQAAAECRVALALGSRDPAARLNLGAALLVLGDPEGAAAEYRELLRADPSNLAARFSLGTALARLGRDEAAIHHYTQALELDPGYHDARLNLANALLRSGHPDAALAHYRLVAQERSDAVTARQGELLCLELLERSSELEQRLEAAARDLPDDPVAAAIRARATARAERERGAPLAVAPGAGRS